MDITLDTLHDKNWILFEGISGSRAYGLDVPTSDTDIKGVFILPERLFFGLSKIEQVNNESNDIVFYELARFVELLAKNNPNLLEMLAPAPQNTRYKHPLFDLLTPDLFLSKLCKDTFAGYAMAQIKKARGLNKKILNPMAKERKSILHFCHVIERNRTQPLLEWVKKEQVSQEACGLVKVPHVKGLFALYHDESGQNGFRGIMQKPAANDISLSSVPKGSSMRAHLYFNKDGYQRYCKDYKAYWEWVEKRNDTRYQNTLAHGKNYDAKNMMHTFRLLDMAEEILRDGKLIVHRPNRQELLEIRAGAFTYEQLIQRAEAKLAQIEVVATKSPLPERPDRDKIEAILVQIRKAWYQK